MSRSRKFCAQLARKKCQDPEKIWARRAHKSCVNSASVAARTTGLRSRSFASRRAFECKIRRESSVKMTQILRKNRAKNLQNFRKSGTPRAQKICVHSASVRCAYFTTSLRVDRVSIACRSEKESVQRRDHANFARNSRERIAKFPKNFGAPRAENLRELGPRGCANLRISLQLCSESAYALTQDNARVQRRDNANVAQ